MWMKLVKEDWTSNEIISLSDLENQLLSRKIFNGNFTISVKDANGNTLKSENVSIDNSACKAAQWQANIANGNFDPAPNKEQTQVLDPSWTFGSEWQFHWDGYYFNGVLLKNFSGASIDLTDSAVDGTAYNVQFMAKAYSDLSSPATVSVVDESGTTVATGQLTVKNEWVKIASAQQFTATMGNKVLSINSDFTGDLLIDHFVVLDPTQLADCTKNVDFVFDGK